MIDRLFELFRQLVDDPDDPAADNNAIVLAAVALLLEVARSDAGTNQIEEQLIRDVLSARFNVTEALIGTLIEAGTEKVENAHDLFQFTQLINDHYDYAKKEHLIHTMWLVALADGRIQAVEDHIIRRVAGLIHVAHEDFIRLKLRAREESQGISD